MNTSHCQATTAAPHRCAVYTRKSTDEGLDRDANSLEVQRDAGLAFIASQRHEDWTLIEQRYDDGGYSGGTMDRPALQRLLEEVRDGRVDVVVVYKIDRLSRSLRDFVKLIELFDEHRVMFVSVTQQFSTTSSMGRLTLNILLSFAQFERELTAERIRDKLAACKAKGMWMGGVPPLGYDVQDRRLVINAEEAALVRDIFQRYAQHGSASRLVRELQTEGHTTKAWISQTGRARTGKIIDQQYLFTMLRNRLYLGEVVYQGQIYPGQHAAIIDRDLWAAVHQHVTARAQGARAKTARHPALLSGLLYTADGQKYLPTFTRKKNGRRYRYYVPYLAKRQGAAECTERSLPMPSALPAAEIERVALEQLQQFLINSATWLATHPQLIDRHDVAAINDQSSQRALNNVGRAWGRLGPADHRLILEQLVERLQCSEQELAITWRNGGWSQLTKELTQGRLNHALVLAAAENPPTKERKK